jgi:hypothetical protein
MTKYKKYFEMMIADNKELFDSFKQLHDSYALNQENLQEKFNAEGGKISEVIREYENRLCANTERGMYNQYSAGLAQKFQDEVRAHFPMIDYIGLKVEKQETPSFAIKKINLN